MKKLAIITVTAAILTGSLTGCIGQMATSAKVMKFNLEVVDNRNARAGLYILMSPVYAISATADLFIFNTIEFWTGTNPISGKSPAVADMPANALIKINQKLSKELTTAPIKLSSANVKQLNNGTLEMLTTYPDGKTQLLRGEKQGDLVNFYLDDTFISAVSIIDLEEYAATRA